MSVDRRRLPVASREFPGGTWCSCQPVRRTWTCDAEEDRHPASLRCDDSRVRGYVGVTDGDWYRYLAASGADEVNFWRPGGGTAFRALCRRAILLQEPLQRWEPHRRWRPFQRIRRAATSEAWQFFGEANGAASIADMRQRVGRYRAAPLEDEEDPVIGCVFVRDVAFFGGGGANPPPSWAPNIVQGSRFDMEEPRPAVLRPLMSRMLVSRRDRRTVASRRSGYGDPRLVPQRLGQRAFQGVVLSAYGYRCASRETRSSPCCKPRIFGHFQMAASIGSIMGCCCAQTSTLV